MTRITFIALAFVARWTEVSGVFQVAGRSIAGRSGVIRLPNSALVPIARGTGITGSARVALISIAGLTRITWVSIARRTGVGGVSRIAWIPIARLRIARISVSCVPVSWVAVVGARW